MARMTTSGLNTADIQGERKINGNGIGIFVAALIFFLLLFLAGGTYFAVYHDSGADKQIQQPEGDRRAQP